jgi:hypothetical protein
LLSGRAGLPSVLRRPDGSPIARPARSFRHLSLSVPDSTAIGGYPRLIHPRRPNAPARDIPANRTLFAPVIAGELVDRTQEVGGSSPPSSTRFEAPALAGVSWFQGSRRIGGDRAPFKVLVPEIAAIAADCRGFRRFGLACALGGSYGRGRPYMGGPGGVGAPRGLAPRITASMHRRLSRVSRARPRGGDRTMSS